MLLQNFKPMIDDKIGHVTILLLSDWLKILELRYATPKKLYKIGSWTRSYKQKSSVNYAEFCYAENFNQSEQSRDLIETI